MLPMHFLFSVERVLSEDATRKTPNLTPRISFWLCPWSEVSLCANIIQCLQMRYFNNTIQCNIRLMQASPAETAATELTLSSCNFSNFKSVLRLTGDTPINSVSNLRVSLLLNCTEHAHDDTLIILIALQLGVGQSV